MKKLSFLPILLLAALLMVGCNEDNKKDARKENRKERRHKPIKSKKNSSKKAEKESSEEIEETGNYDSSRYLIEMGLIEARKSFPTEAEEGITIVDANIEGNYVIYDAVCDESILSIDALNSNKKEVKKLIKSNL